MLVFARLICADNSDFSQRFPFFIISHHFCFSDVSHLVCHSCLSGQRPNSSRFCLSSSRTRGSILKREDVFESIKPTKSVRPALVEVWIPACAGMTDIESGEISYRPRLCLLASLLLVILAFARHPRFCSSSSRMRGAILKREDVFESIKPTKSMRSALVEKWIPAYSRMTDIESGEISYRLWLLLVILNRLNQRKECVQRLLRNGLPPARE